jgi:hypothetical protein
LAPSLFFSFPRSFLSQFLCALRRYLFVSPFACFLYPSFSLFTRVSLLRLGNPREEYERKLGYGAVSDKSTTTTDNNEEGIQTDPIETNEMSCQAPDDLLFSSSSSSSHASLYSAKRLFKFVQSATQVMEAILAEEQKNDPSLSSDSKSSSSSSSSSISEQVLSLILPENPFMGSKRTIKAVCFSPIKPNVVAIAYSKANLVSRSRVNERMRD